MTVLIADWRATPPGGAEEDLDYRLTVDGLGLVALQQSSDGWVTQAVGVPDPVQVLGTLIEGLLLKARDSEYEDVGVTAQEIALTPGTADREVLSEWEV